MWVLLLFSFVCKYVYVIAAMEASAKVKVSKKGGIKKKDKKRIRTDEEKALSVSFLFFVVVTESLEFGR